MGRDLGRETVEPMHIPGRTPQTQHTAVGGGRASHALTLASVQSGLVKKTAAGINGRSYDGTAKPGEMTPRQQHLYHRASDNND